MKSVFKKEIHKLPKRLQRMRLALQKYNLDVQYKKGYLMYIADTLSQAYMKTTEGVLQSPVRFAPSRRYTMKNMCEWTPPNEMWEQIAADPEIQELIRIIIWLVFVADITRALIG